MEQLSSETKHLAFRGGMSTCSIYYYFLKISCFPWLHFAEIGDSVLTIKGPQGRINRAVWGPLNRTIISAGEDAVIRIWDSEVCILELIELHIYRQWRQVG